MGRIREILKGIRDFQQLSGAFYRKRGMAPAGCWNLSAASASAGHCCFSAETGGRKAEGPSGLFYAGYEAAEGRIFVAEHTFTRRNIIRGISFLVAILLFGAGVYLAGRANRRQYQMQLEQNYQRQLSELFQSLDGMGQRLEELRLAVDGAPMAQKARDTGRVLGEIRDSLLELPLGRATLPQTTSFFDQGEGLLNALAGQLSRGVGLSADDREQLDLFHRYLSDFRQDLDPLRKAVERGSPTALRVFQDLARSGIEEGQGSTAALSLYTLDQRFAGWPGVTYQGMTGENASAVLTDAPQMSLEDAKKRAAGLLGLKEDQLTAGEQLSDPDTGILTYLFTGTGKEKARKALITVQGGYPLYFTRSAAGAASKYSVEEILRRAGEWVSSQGFTGMQQSFFRIQDNLCTIWFHYYEGGVICYPDEIQVIVSMDSGETVGMDTRQYMLHHTQRTLEEPVLTVNDAGQRLSGLDGVTVKDIRLSVFQPDSDGERLCYEIYAEDGNGWFLIYLDAADGRQEAVRKLCQEDSGSYLA